MAAISATTITNSFTTIRTATAQATTGQTDWLKLPEWANYGQIFFNLTALAGTTRVATPSFQVCDPISQNDSHVVNLAEHAALTGITAVGQYVYEFGPGLTGIANDVTQSATADSYVSLNCIVPLFLGVTLLLDRAEADETYTYTLSLLLKGRR